MLKSDWVCRVKCKKCKMHSILFMNFVIIFNCSLWLELLIGIGNSNWETIKQSNWRINEWMNEMFNCGMIVISILQRIPFTEIIVVSLLQFISLSDCIPDTIYWCVLPWFTLYQSTLKATLWKFTQIVCFEYQMSQRRRAKCCCFFDWLIRKFVFFIFDKV